jgi:hypothetical protein
MVINAQIKENYVKIVLEKYRIKQIIFILIGILLFYFAAFREIGADYDSRNYKSLFDTSDKLGLIRIEPTFLFFSWIIHKYLFNNIYILFAIYALLGITFKLYAIRSLSQFWALSLFIYISNFFLLHEMTQIRAGVAAGILLLAIKPLYEKNFKHFFLLTCIAFLFHYSALLILPLYFINTKKIKSYYYISAILIVYILHFFNIHFSIILDFIPIPSIQYKLLIYKKYVLLNMHNKIHVFNPFQVLHLIFCFIFLWKANAFQQKNKYSILLIKLYAIATFSLVALSDIPVLAFRVSEMLSISEIILIPHLIYMFKPRILTFALIFVVQLGVLLLNIFHSQIIIL